MLLLTPPPPPLLVVLLLLVVVVEVVLGSTLPPLFGILTVLMRERNAGYDLSSFIDFLSLSVVRLGDSSNGEGVGERSVLVSKFKTVGFWVVK